MTSDSRRANQAGDVFAAFLKLGLTSFGGPIAHIGYFRNEFVERRRWLDEQSYADIVALCQLLPGPASSQVGMAIGFLRAGYIGALAAWTAFTLPSAMLLVLFAYGIASAGQLSSPGWIHGLKIAAVAVVAQALLGMIRTLTPDASRASLAVLAAVIVLAMPSALGQIGAIVVGGLMGLALLREGASPVQGRLKNLPGRLAGMMALGLFAVMLVALPLLAAATGAETVRLFDVFYRVGSLVFGGGHVVLPLLQAEVVPAGWIGNDAFLAGYGVAQAMPGPLFTFAAYLGAMIGGWSIALLCLAAIFLPSFLLVMGILPFWNQLRVRPDVQAGLRGVNAAVVGLLLAAFYDPVWTSGITSKADFGLVTVAFLLLLAWRTPPWLVVLLCAAGAQVMTGI
jgi:chromate transporter